MQSSLYTKDNVLCFHVRTAFLRLPIQPDGNRCRPTAPQDPHSLPKSLAMLAADAGRGLMPLGSTAAKQGRRVATVFEDPGIDTSDVEINRNTREPLIAGNGFTKFRRPMIHVSIV